MEIKDPALAEKVAQWFADHKRAAMRIERRYICEDVQIRIENKVATITGYAAVFNQRVPLWKGFYEEVAPGAFTKSIQTDDVRALINHDPNLLLGRTKAGTLTLSEDAHGLKYEVMSPDTSYARDLEISLKRKDITQSSFGFNIVEYGERTDKKTGDTTVTLKEVKLFDVSPVTFPAYPGTEAHVRMIAGEKEIAYVYEDSGQVVVLSAEEKIAESVIDLPSEDELLRRSKEMRERIYGS